MNTKPEPLSKYVQVDASAARMARLWTSVSHRLTSKTPLYRRRPVFVLVAAAGLVLGAAGAYSWLAWHGATPAVRSATVLQTASDRLTVELGKGVTLQLAAHSRAQLPVGGDGPMSVRLQYGTIVCDLDSRSTRGFSVLVENLEVRDTGTRFSVSLEPGTGQIDVSVERGSVEVLGATGVPQAKSISAGERWSRQRQSEPGHAASATIASEATGPIPPTPAAASAGSPPTPRSNAQRDQAPQVSGRDPVEYPSAQALFEQASAARRAGDPNSASQALQNLIARYPNDTRVGLAALELGRLRMGALSDLPGAVRAFQTALARAPSAGFREDALAHLIEAYAALGATAQVHALCQRYLSEYPNGVHRALVARKCGGN